MAVPPKEGTPEYRSMKRVYKHYVRQCRIRNVYWELTVDQFKVLTSSNCAYCGKQPTNRRSNYLYSGIDRKNNKQGYTLDNSVPCCKVCNSIKGAHLTFEEMRAAMEAVCRYRSRR
jgi:5-methylcytosine-specific restriction endonuclease McrA